MFVLMVIFVGLIVGLADVFLFKCNKSAKKSFVTVLVDAAFVNFVIMFIFDLIFKFFAKIDLFPIGAHSTSFPFVYFAGALIVGLGWILVSAFFDKVVFVEKQEKSSKILNCLSIIASVFVALGTAAYTGTVWGMDCFNGVAPDQLIVNLTSPTEGTSQEVMDALWSGPVLHTFTVLFLFVLLISSKYTFVYVRKQKKYRLITPTLNKIICCVLSVAILCGGMIYGVKEFQLLDLYDMYFTESTFIDDNFADPRTVKMQFPEKKRNLIHIYLESMENTYLSTDLGGYMNENLMPNLTELAKEGVSFSHRDSGFGGPITTRGCNWSVASMTNMSTGLPMKVPTQDNSYGKSGVFLPGAVAIGDILKNQGYSCTVMFGASAKFGGLDVFYKSHGDFNILDYDAAKEKGWIPQDYKEWWGFEDDKLFEFAKNELENLSNGDKPFYFVMETADTHFPDGYVSKNTPTPRDSQYANVIAYSDSEVVKFVRWIQSQPFYENTTIVIIGDHISMDKNFFENVSADYLRTTFNLIVNPADDLINIPEDRKFNRYWFNGDMFPTMLASLGVKIEGERLGLGTNLFSDKPTIMEENGKGLKGWEYVDKQFNYRSSYYVEHILFPNTPFDNKNVTTY